MLGEKCIEVVYGDAINVAFKDVAFCGLDLSGVIHVVGEPNGPLSVASKARFAGIPIVPRAMQKSVPNSAEYKEAP